MTVGIYKQKASDVMSTHVDAIHCKETLRDALTMMANNHLTALPVVDGKERCVGIISQSDLIEITESDLEFQSSLKLFGGLALEQVTSERIEDVMTDRVVSVLPDLGVPEVADLMLDQSIHHIPVCDEDGKLRGIISTMDILAGLRQPSKA